MKIILCKDVEKVGVVGDVLKVKDGFARNFLIPNGLALMATKDNLKKTEDIKAVKAKELQKHIDQLQETADKIASLSLTISAEVNEKEQLYGSISALDVSSALKEEGYEVLESNIKLDNPIKSLGIYEVPIKLHPQVVSSVKIWVVKK